MTSTLEEIKEQQTKLAEMIASIEAAMKEPRFFEYQGKRIPLADGERYAGTIISAWVQVFGLGYQDGYDKSAALRARAVRRIEIK